MAIPPDPIDELMPKTAGCVVGEVTAILQTWKQAPLPQPKDNKGWADLPGDLAQQTIRLRVDEVLYGALGAKGTELEVTKPAGDYTLRPGAKGPFLLRAPADKEKHPVIVGRYGPDSYRQDVIEAAAKRAGKRA
jgi:hypothetical protein